MSTKSLTKIFLFAVVALCVLASSLAIEESSHPDGPKDDGIAQTKNHPLHQPNVGPIVALISVGEPTSTEKTWQLYATYSSDAGVLNLSVLIVVLSCILLVAIGFLFGWVLKTVCCSSAPTKGEDAALVAHDEEASAPLVIAPAPRQWSKNESMNK